MAVCKTCGHAMADEQAKASPFCLRCGVSDGAEPVPRGERETWLHALEIVAPILAMLLVVLVKWWRGW